MNTVTHSVGFCVHCGGVYHTAADIRAAGIKPHLRLRYTPPGAPGNRSGMFPWSVEYVRGTNQRARRETYQHNTAGGAVLSAGQLWF